MVTGSEHVVRDVWDAPPTASGVAGHAPVNPYASAPIADNMPDAVQADDIIGGRFQLIRRIGAGGMSEVWEAVHTVLGRPLAVKVVSLTANREAAARLLREAKTIARIQNENVIEIVDFGRTPLGAPFLVMELLRGEPLSQLLEREGALPWPRAKRLGLQVVSALVAAHGAGVLHRDVKPGNVFVRTTVDGERVKLLDFGISRVHSLSPEETAVTHADELIGTPAFMSPEQIHGKEIDVRSDVYAMGCVLFALLAGYGPFDAPTKAETLFRQLYEEAPSLRETPRGAEIPASIETIVQRCLRKNPGLRFPTMLDLHAALEAATPTSGNTLVPLETLPQPAAELRARYQTLRPVAQPAPPRPGPPTATIIRGPTATGTAAAAFIGASAALGVAALAYFLAPRLLGTDPTPAPPPTISTPEAQVAVPPTRAHRPVPAATNGATPAPPPPPPEQPTAPAAVESAGNVEGDPVEPPPPTSAAAPAGRRRPHPSSATPVAEREPPKRPPPAPTPASPDERSAGGKSADGLRNPF